jgi:hypothetical protein
VVRLRGCRPILEQEVPPYPHRLRDFDSDLFAEKIKSGRSIRVAFPKYKGDGSYDDSISYIKASFCNVDDPKTGKAKDIYTHVTCATDTNNVKVVFGAIKEFIINKALQTQGMIV